MTEKESSGNWLNQTTLGIGLASFFSDVGHEMATAALPAFLASLGINSAILGLIESLSDGLASFAKFYSGVFSDRLSRKKPLAVIGYGLTALGVASFALATNGWEILLGRMVGWFGRGVRGPVRNVLLSEATTPETHGRAFGFDRAMDSAGAVLGPLLAILLGFEFGLRTLFVLTLIPGLLAALIFAFFVKEKRRDKREKTGFKKSLQSLPASFKRYLLGLGLAGIGNFSNTLLILWATLQWTPRFGPALAATLAMLFYAGYNVVYALSCFLSGRVADRFPKNRVLAVGYAVAAVPAAILLYPGDSMLKFAAIFGFSGLYMGVWKTLEPATAAGLLPVGLRGSGFGVLAAINGLGDMISSALVGFLWVFSPLAAMSFVMASSLLGAFVIASP